MSPRSAQKQPSPQGAGALAAERVPTAAGALRNLHHMLHTPQPHKDRPTVTSGHR